MAKWERGQPTLEVQAGATIGAVDIMAEASETTKEKDPTSKVAEKETKEIPGEREGPPGKHHRRMTEGRPFLWETVGYVEKGVIQQSIAPRSIPQGHQVCFMARATSVTLEDTSRNTVR